MRGFKIAHGRLGKQLRTAHTRVAQLFEQRRDVPHRLEVRDLNERAVVKLATESTRCLMRAPFRTNGEGSNFWLAARVLYRAPAFRQTRSIVFMPPIYDWSTSGTAIVPSACW